METPPEIAIKQENIVLKVMSLSNALYFSWNNNLLKYIQFQVSLCMVVLLWQLQKLYSNFTLTYKIALFYWQ